MYKCMDCGNTEKFIGVAKEKGTAEFNRSGNGYQWLYRISDSNWKSDCHIRSCYYCQSKNIVKI